MKWVQLSFKYLVNLEIYLNLSYENTYTLAQPASLLRLWNIPKWEWNKTNTNLLKSITNNIAPFVSITWHQKEPLGCVVYSHCPTNDSYNICIHSCCLPCNYVTKSFGILQRVIKSQRVYIYYSDLAKVDTSSLRKVNATKFSEIFKLK